MKKLSAALMMTATVLGLAAATTSAMTVHADDTTPANAGNTPVHNTATLNVEGGTLSMTTPKDVDFGTANVTNAYNGDYATTPLTGTADDMSTTISDFLGDNGTWTLNVAQGGWMQGATANDALNQGAKLTINSSSSTDGADGAVDANATLSGEATPIATGKAGTTVSKLAYKLAIAKGTNLTTGTYTNTLTWSLSNTPGNAAE